MRVAFSFTSTFGKPLVDDDGRLVGGDSGRYLLKRLMGLWADPVLLADEDRQCYGFEMRRVSRIEPNQTRVISMDVLNSPALYQELKTWHGAFPKISNFVWWNVSEYTDKTQLALIGQSAATFPTFCNSARTGAEVRDRVRREVSAARFDLARMVSCPLGIDVSVPALERTVNEVPVVMYPAMWLFDRKRPGKFLEITDSVRAAEKIRVVAALHDSVVPSDAFASRVEVMDFASDDGYRRRLASCDAFMATAVDESYGLQYLEALHAGMIGVFPERAWAQNVLPPDYPFLYSTDEQAKTMLLWIVRNLDAARESIRYMPAWIEKHHARTTFEDQFRQQIEDWWPER